MFRRTAVAVVVAVVAPAVSAAAGMGGDPVAHARVQSAKAKCTKKPFVGKVARTAEESTTGQPAAERTSSDFTTALVYDFGSDKNYTVYLSEQRLDPADLGGTLEAPDGDVLVTIFLRSAKGSSLDAGTKLVASKDPVSVVIDAGAGARAVTSNPSGKVTLLASSKQRLCFAIDYRDDHQTVDGVVNATLP